MSDSRRETPMPSPPAPSRATGLGSDRRFWLAAGVTAAGLLAVVLYGAGDRPSAGQPTGRRALKGRTDPPPPVSRTRDASDPRERRLLTAGWDPESARTVLAYHAGFLAALSADSPTAADAALDRLAVLGRSPKAHSLLRTQPELAGPLAAVTDPDAAVDVFVTAGEDATALVNCLLLAGDRPARDDAVAVFARHAHRIALLQRMGVFGVEALFPARLHGDGDRAFDRWLADALDAAVRDDDLLAAVVLFARGQGLALRERMAGDATFRARFDDLWAALRRVCSAPGHPLELYLDEPAVWDVLMRPGGEELLRRRGLLAVALLHGPKAYPKPLHDRVAGLVLAGDGTTFNGLYDGPFRDHPQFRDLLAAKLPDDLLARVVADLLAAGGHYAPKLRTFWLLRETPTKLGATVADRGPGALQWIPFYTTAVVAGKLLTGERVSDDEWVGAGTDLVAAVVPVSRVGKLVVTQSLKRVAAETAVRKLGTAAAEKAATTSAREVRRWSATALLEQSRRAMGQVGRLSSVDVTSAVRVAYRRSGVGRDGFRRLTGLEARVFMRRDGRVVVHLDRLAWERTRAYLTDRVKESVEEAVADTPAGRHAAKVAAAAVSLLDAVELPTISREDTR